MTFSFPGVRWLKAPDRDTADDTTQIAATVARVLADVAATGDAAVRRYSQQFDKADLETFEVSLPDRLSAVAELDPQTRADTEFAIGNVTAFAQAQFATILPLDVEIRPGVFMGHRVIPIERVGCYVPGGRFPLLSAPIMTIVPAQVAGWMRSSPACRPMPIAR